MRAFRLSLFGRVLVLLLSMGLALTVTQLADPAPAEAFTKSQRQTAIEYARKQVGKPYAWGGTGPSSYDCSGLVQRAYRKAGVTLPRTSRQMYQATKRVSRSNLRRGDLLFFFSPVSHVGIYIGNNKMIDASSSRRRVVIRDVFWGSYVGAGRL